MLNLLIINISKWQMGSNSAFKGSIRCSCTVSLNDIFRPFTSHLQVDHVFVCKANYTISNAMLLLSTISRVKYIKLN